MFNITLSFFQKKGDKEKRPLRSAMESIEEYAKKRADIAYGKKPSIEKEEFIKSIIKKNIKWQKHSGGNLGETTATHSHHGFQIQSVLVPKDKFSKSEAIKYIKKHFEYKKIDSTQRPRFYSFRQIEPTQNSKYFTKVLDNGVELVFENTFLKKRLTQKKPIGPDSIKPRNLFDQVFEGSKGNEVDRRPVKSEGGSFKVHEIYKFIKNGHLEGDNREKITGYTFIEELSDRHYQVYQNKKNKIIVINYSGTREWSDWLNNLDYIFRTYNLSARYKKAKAILNTVLKDYPNYQIRLIGYSQSGIIVRELAKLYSDEIFEIISLNPGNLSIYEGDAPKHEYVIKSDLDFASFFRKPEKNDIIIKSETSNIATEHLPEILFRLNPDLEIGRKK